MHFKQNSLELLIVTPKYFNWLTTLILFISAIALNTQYMHTQYMYTVHEYKVSIIKYNYFVSMPIK